VVLEIRNVAGASDTYEDTIIIGLLRHQIPAPVITLVGVPMIDVVGGHLRPGTTVSTTWMETF
jgi:hypothetical protein